MPKSPKQFTEQWKPKLKKFLKKCEREFERLWLTVRKSKPKQWIRWTGWASLAGIGMLMIIVAVIVFEVYFGDDSKLKRTTILARINQETAIYCNDEQTPLGSFFSDSRRRYININEIPNYMLNAMVAAEDKNFYEHGGIDVTAIFNAFAEGIASGGFKRGGSTITQQTVKNILDSWEHSFRRKFREWIAAIQLERMYDKRTILEFYLNQFHVAGNGKGIGIAARYYFDKNVQDLTLVEAAFIAGSVKGPSKYNPFIKFTEEERNIARKNAFERKNYVLEKMSEQGWISAEELKTALKEQIPFNRGKFRVQEVSLVNMVRDDLNKKEILETLGVEDINELSSAGLKVISTIDCELQADAQQKMRQNLSRLETILKGFKVEDESSFAKLRVIDVGNFYYGKIKKINEGKEPTIEIDMGYPQGLIPYESLKRAAMLVDLATGKGLEKQLKEMLGQMKVGDVLYSEVVDYDKDKNLATLELRKSPIINGGLITLDKGEVRTVVTGWDTQGFNRALQAKRPPGSVFKAVVYYAALQLGWTILDRLENTPQVFTYQDQFYYPRADHASAYPNVSIVWAGVLSENLASVYLAAHLIDKLNFDQFRQLLDYMGLAPNRGESANAYNYRITKALGVQPNQDGIYKHLFNEAAQSVASDLMLDGMSESAEMMSRVWWGPGYLAELQKIYQNQDDHNLAEMYRRVRLLKNNYQRLESVGERLVQDWDKLASDLETMSPSEAFRSSAYASLLKNFRVQTGHGSKPTLAYYPTIEAEDPINQKMDKRIAAFNEKAVKKYIPPMMPGRPLNSLDLKAIWGKGGVFNSSTNVAVEDVLLDGYYSMKDFKKLTDKFDEYKEDSEESTDTYGLNRLFKHHDFRIALGLNYLTSLTKALGVESPIEPILSYPLGTNDVSIAEIGKIFQTFTDGNIYRFYKEGPPNQITFIKRIEDSERNVVYETKRRTFQVVSEQVTQQIREILRRVVTHGTGSRARSELYVTTQKKGKDMNILIPSFGKTGTTNDFTTSSYAGFIPYPAKQGAQMDPANSYTIAAYVGYDLNETMQNGRIKVYGSVGALPLWTDVGRSIIEKKKFVDSLDPFDIEVMGKREWQLKFDTNLQNILVDLPRGGIIGSSGSYTDQNTTTSNRNVDGEVFTNEFALTAGVKANLYVPMSRGGFFSGQEPMRTIEFFNDPYESFMQDYEETRTPNAQSSFDQNKADKEPAGEDNKKG